MVQCCPVSGRFYANRLTGNGHRSYRAARATQLRLSAVSFRDGCLSVHFPSRKSELWGEGQFSDERNQEGKRNRKIGSLPRKTLRRLHQPSGPAIGNGQMINNSNDVFSNRMNRFALGLALSPFKKMREDKRAQVER